MFNDRQKLKTENLKLITEKMKITCIICEYNPFHNGHLYMIERLRESGTTHIAAVMSGNFTQRGEAALYDKYTRARAAIACGADLVVGMPTDFSCSGAERFAFGGVYIADALGCADALAFGSESGDIDLIRKAASAVTDERVNSCLSEYMKTGMTFAAAREKAVRQIYGGTAADVLRTPNDILGVEYIKALMNINSSIAPQAVKRRGASHDSRKISGNIASASLIRNMKENGDNRAFDYIPEQAAEIFRQAEDQPPPEGRMKRIENIILYRLKTMTAEEMSMLPDVGEGLENRLYCAARSCKTVQEIIYYTKSKRYTYSRIARIICSAFLNIKKTEMSEHPRYIQVLSMNDRGREILRSAKHTASLPVVTRYADVRRIPDIQGLYDREMLYDEIYEMTAL